MNRKKKLLHDVKTQLSALGNPTRAKITKRFFQTGPGQYGEGDIFIGVTVPDIRRLAKKNFCYFSQSELLRLLRSKIHEERLLALIMMIHQFQTATKANDEKTRKKLFILYLKNTKFINNWDLVDSSAEHIVGAFLHKKSKARLIQLARSKRLWERRLAIVSTFYYIKYKESKETIRLAKLLLHDSHNLIHKAVGWMLREMGKKCGNSVLEKFLASHAKAMPRTMLRYAIEQLPPETRMIFLKG